MARLQESNFSARIILDYQVGLSLKKIAIKYNVSTSLVRKILTINNIATRKYTDYKKYILDLEVIKEKYDSGSSCEKIAKEIGCSDSIVYRLLLKNNSIRKKTDWSGEISPNWKGGFFSKNIPLRHFIRQTAEYKEWRDKVYQRDKFTCQKCFQVGKTIHAHHIYQQHEIIQDYLLINRNDYKLLTPLFDVNNGLTLCRKCHYLEHSIKNSSTLPTLKSEREEIYV